MNSNTSFVRQLPARCLSGLCSLLLCASAFGSGASAVAQLGHGVVVDSSGELVFTMHPKAGIQATSIKTGESVWRSVVADRPVSAGASALLGQLQASEAGVLQLVYIDKNSGESLKALDVAIPSNMWARVTDSLDDTFAVRPVQSGGAESLYWQHTYKQVQGAQLTAKEAPAQVTEGFLTADFVKQTVTTTSGPNEFKAAAHRRATMPANAPGRRALYSLDQQHVVTSTALSAEERQSSAAGDRYQWHVYTQAGEKVRSFSSAVSFAPYVVVQNKLLYVTSPRKVRRGDKVVVEPASLLGIDLNTGDQALKVAIKDTQYRGPFPP